ncbi:MAG: OmpH family outer membrane protein [Bacteroidota bacterium]|nr:OmpH family outer membrane protein [Bacteroidota bacterium]
MLRKIALSLLLICSVGLFAQDLKFGHVSIQDLASSMPEMIDGRKKLDDTSKQYEKELAQMYSDLNKKYTEFTSAKDSLPESIKNRRIEELQGLEQRFNNFKQQSSEEIQKQQSELERSVMEMIVKAVKAVGDENGYVYIMDKNSALYISSTKSTDVTELVKAKLKAMPKPAATTAKPGVTTPKPAAPAAKPRR